MEATRESIYQFVQYCKQHIQGKERADAQSFLNEFFKAFGHAGAKQAGATFELPIPKASSRGHIGYADLWWPRDRLATLLIEMKSRGENLHRHYGQAWDYCKQLNPQPKYVILCNFDEFWIYDFEIQVDTPLDKIRLEDLYERLETFRFMEFTAEAPVFKNNQVEITQVVAKRMGEFYQSLKARSNQAGFNVTTAQKFTLQCVMAMFAEDTKLLKNNIFSQCLEECLQGKSSFDLLNDGLFRRMNMLSNPVGRFQGVDYFNGGLFGEVYAIELNIEELGYLELASNQDWGKVRPAIFGSIFESTVNEEERHQGGIHFTSENDIMKIIRPTISRYWEEKIDESNSLKDLEKLKVALSQYQVLDPACGSGNFLYMAYQELKQAEYLLLKKYAELQKTDQLEISFVTPLQFHGIDRNPFAVELARITLLIARKVAIDKLGLTENPLPLDSLDKNIIQGDALLIDWPPVKAIVGNPPFQSKNKIKQEFGLQYVNQIRDKYPSIPGRADYCVYWFYKAHQQLPEEGCAGLVGTNTIRQNYSREGGLDYIVNNGGIITEAVSTQVWSGDAVVHVSIVNWVKGEKAGKKKLLAQLGDSLDSPWQVWELDYINSSLSATTDVSQAKKILVNANSGTCYQGQTHGHEGFLLTPTQSLFFVTQQIINQEVIFPYLTADELFSTYPPLPQRYVIDFHPRNLKESSLYNSLLQHIENHVLPTRKIAAQNEIKRNQELLKTNPTARVNRHHQNFLAKWWLLSYPRPELIQKINTISRYIVCGQVTKRPIFEFISASIRPNAALIVFSLEDDYSFGILQSNIHWQWLTNRCSTLKKDFRYTSDTVFDTFPFPQSPTLLQVQQVAEAAVSLRQIRRQIMARNQWNLRHLYRHLSDTLILQQAHDRLDQTVALAYGIEPETEPLQFLLNLNLQVTAKEANGETITPPGLPDFVSNRANFISPDCVSMNE